MRCVELILASSNRHKVKEISALFSTDDLADKPANTKFAVIAYTNKIAPIASIGITKNSPKNLSDNMEHR